MVFKKGESIDSLEQLQVPASIKRFVEDLSVRYEEGTINQDVEKQMEKDWSKFQSDVNKGKRNRIQKRIATFSISVAASMALFVGSAFVSPAMAKVAANIPYLNQLFESKPLTQEISEALNEHGYKGGDNWDGLGVLVQPREVSVMILGSEEYYQKAKEPVTKIITDILADRNYDAYSVKVTKGFEIDTARKSKEQLELEAIQHQVVDQVTKVLKGYGYSSFQHGFVSAKELEVSLPDTEEKMEEIKGKLVSALEESNLNDYSVKVLTFDAEQRAMEARWMPIITNISDGLTAKKEYHVKKLRYGVSEGKISITVQTNLKVNDDKTGEVATKIENTINEFLTSNEIKQTIQDDPYQLIISSRNNTKLN